MLIRICGQLGMPYRGDGRKIGSAEERPLVRRQKNVHRPAAAARRELDEIHIDLVDVRPLFHIDLDVDEILVHDRGRRLVLERLVLHHMAPVTRRIADADQHGLVLGLRPFKCLVAPRIPVDRVMCVLQAGKD